MPQFLIGFWCGCAAATLVLCLLYTNRKRQSGEETGNAKVSEDEKNAFADDRGVASTKMRVLLVDDSRLSRTIIKDFLAKRDVEIFEAADGTESLKLAKKNKFDLIFMDQNMPGLNGDETLHRLWTDGGVGWDVPVVAVGSTVRKEHETEFQKRGYVACLGKPIQENRLEEIVSQVLSETRENPEPEGFSYQSGLGNFDGNEAVYRETLVLFASLWEERKEQLKQFLEEENAQEYAILIHAIKGDARTLGAKAFGELAYAHEVKAKEGKMKWISENFEQVVKTGDKTAEYFKQTFSE